MIGLAVTREGIPVRVWVWPGNTSDMTVIEQVKDDLRDWRLGRVVTVTRKAGAACGGSGIPRTTAGTYGRAAWG